MATKLHKDIYPPVDPECLSVLEDLYSRYTGYQIAACIGVIRAEIQRQREEDQLDLEIAQLLLKKSSQNRLAKKSDCLM